MPVFALLAAVLAVAPISTATGAHALDSPSPGNMGKGSGDGVSREPGHGVSPTVKSPQSMYTTYFYTAGEAVIHGYNDDTTVRIVSMDKRGTVYQGKVGVGESVTVNTGAGIFGFLSDKKAAILVGTPTSCSVVGYFVKDEDGNFRSERFFTQVPARTFMDDERIIVWGYEPSSVKVIDRKTEHVLAEGNLDVGKFIEIKGEALRALSNQTLEIRASKGKVSVQVYYDEGFIVPADNGRGAGQRFYVYAGKITNGTNDLDLIAQLDGVQATVTDLDKNKVLWTGSLEKGQVKVVGLLQQHVKVESTRPISVALAAFDDSGPGYQEQHFGTGIEGAGIENDFLITTSGQLWLFSYYSQNDVDILDARTGKQVAHTSLGANSAQTLDVGLGLFRVKSHKGLSVMGGAGSCGADYSPAAGMFAVDEALMNVLAEVRAERQLAAEKEGKTLTPAEAAAPMTKAEWSRHEKTMAAPAAAGYSMSADEANERAAEMQQK